MIYELDKETIDFICKKKLSFTQFAICLLLNSKDVAGIIQINNEIGTIGEALIKGSTSGKYISEIDDLISRGYILNHELGGKHAYDLDNFIVTPKFTSGFLLDQIEICEELWKYYPKNLFINGMEYPSKACTFDEFSEAYLKTIKGSLKLHKEVISKLLNYNATHEYAQMKIMNFVGSRHWENLTDSAVRKTRAY